MIISKELKIELLNRLQETDASQMIESFYPSAWHINYNKKAVEVIHRWMLGESMKLVERYEKKSPNDSRLRYGLEIASKVIESSTFDDELHSLSFFLSRCSNYGMYNERYVIQEFLKALAFDVWSKVHAHSFVTCYTKYIEFNESKTSEDVGSHTKPIAQIGESLESFIRSLEIEKESSSRL